MTLLLQLGCLFGLLALISWLLIARLTVILRDRNIMDRPDHRTLHIGAVPRGGGLVIISALILALLIAAFSSGRTLFFACLALLVLGWAALSWSDDKYGLSPRKRLLIQILLCFSTVAAFGWVDQVFGVNIGLIGVIVSLIGVLWMANLYNFMDGIDGLAAAQTIVASTTLGFWFYMAGDTPMALVCLTLAAASYGFILHNWCPAKIFMGDVGSISIGAFFGTLIIIGTNRHEISVLNFLGLFAVFVLDSSLTIIRRCIKGEKIWLPHRQHYYQRLATAGYSHSQIAISAIILMIICSLLATLSVAYHDMIVFSILGILITLIATLILVVWLEKQASHPPTHPPTEH